LSKKTFPVFLWLWTVVIVVNVITENILKRPVLFAPSDCEEWDVGVCVWSYMRDVILWGELREGYLGRDGITTCSRNTIGGNVLD
jgi:hypothetical protein